MSQVKIIGKAILEHHGFFSVDQIVALTKITRRYCQHVLALFCQEGIIKQIKKGRRKHVFAESPTFVLIYRVVDRKRLIARIAPRQSESTVQNRMWFILWNKFRNNGSFNLHDLTVLAGAKKEIARSYLKALRRGGYILPSRKAGPGVEWRLIGKFGPDRPYVSYGHRFKRRLFKKEM